MKNVHDESADTGFASRYVVLPIILSSLLSSANTFCESVDMDLATRLVNAAFPPCDDEQDSWLRGRDSLELMCELGCARPGSTRLFRTAGINGIDALVILDRGTGVSSEPADSTESDALRLLEAIREVISH